MSYWQQREAVQSYLRERGWRGWLLMDFRGTNPLFWQVLGRGAQGGHLTRRTFFWIPTEADAESEIPASPRLPLSASDERRGGEVALVHAIEAGALRDDRWEVRTYHNGQSLRDALAGLGIAGGAVAMEYSPMGDLPYVSRVDGGTLDIVRSLGADVVSSADLLQLAIARWDERQVEQHRRAAELVDGVKNDAFALIGERLRAGDRVDEYAVARFIEQRFVALDLATMHSPTVGVGPNSANAHYEPVLGAARSIERDQWVLVDLWGRVNEPGSTYADVTWVAWTGPSPVPEDHRRVFEIVRRARDLALERLASAAQQGRATQGWEIDRAVRDYIAGEGYGDYFTHRTGHNLGPEELHGSAGVCLDDFETHDTRLVLPGVAFSVEPGVYLPDRFGVRLELNAVMQSDGPHVYTPVQREIITLL
jgi:Xaa-Pro aminopeptidase